MSTQPDSPPEVRLLPLAYALYTQGLPLTEHDCRMVRLEAEGAIIECLKRGRRKAS